MSTLTRRSALAAFTALALPAQPEATEGYEDSRPVFVPLEHSPFREIDVDTLNARRLESHEGSVWAYDHRDSLPTDYEEIDDLPANYREAVLAALPVTTTVALVLERIQRCADADPDLTDEQRAVIAGAPLTLTPEWSEASNDEREARWPDGGFWQRTREAFTAEEWSRIFGSDDIEDWWPFARCLGLGGCAKAVGW
jgi:hypothetical protein